MLKIEYHKQFDGETGVIRHLFFANILVQVLGMDELVPQAIVFSTTEFPSQNKKQAAENHELQKKAARRFFCNKVANMILKEEIVFYLEGGQVETKKIIKVVVE